MDEITISQSTSPLDRSGYGSYGSVWADSSRFPDIDQCDTSAIVLKRGDRLADRSIKNKAKMHKHILSSIGSFCINIPQHIASSNQDARIGVIFFLGFLPIQGHVKPSQASVSFPYLAILAA